MSYVLFWVESNYYVMRLSDLSTFWLLWTHRRGPHWPNGWAAFVRAGWWGWPAHQSSPSQQHWKHREHVGLPYNSPTPSTLLTHYLFAAQIHFACLQLGFVLPVCTSMDIHNLTWISKALVGVANPVSCVDLSLRSACCAVCGVESSAFYDMPLVVRHSHVLCVHTGNYTSWFVLSTYEHVEVIVFWPMDETWRGRFVSLFQTEQMCACSRETLRGWFVFCRMC